MSKCRSCGNEYIGYSCKPCRNIKQKQYRLLNKDKILSQAKVSQKKYREKNKEKINKTIREWIERNKERIAKYKAEWTRNNPSKRKARRNNRRARIKNCEGTISSGLYDRLIVLQKNKCACCKIDFKKIKADMDHILPLALGGKNEDWNIQLLCKKCNGEKYIKHPIDFMQSKGYLL